MPFSESQIPPQELAKELCPHNNMWATCSECVKLLKRRSHYLESTQRSIHAQSLRRLGQIFDACPTPEERMNMVVTITGDLFDDTPVHDHVALTQELQSLLIAIEKEDFIQTAWRILEPYFREREKHHWEVNLKEKLEQKGEKQLNEMVTYKLSPDEAQAEIHIGPFSFAPQAEKMNLFEDALYKLAQECKKNPNLQEIIADSWIVFRRPTLLEKLGFKLDPQWKQEIIMEAYNLEERKKTEAHLDISKVINNHDSATATIDRDTLIKRYGN